MKKTIQKLISASGEAGENDKGKFFSIKGGLSLMMVSTNAACNNTGTCSGTNNGECSNGWTADCSKATNVPATSCDNALCGD